MNGTLKIPPGLTKRLCIIEGPVLHQYYAEACPEDRVAWGQLTEQQQKGWCAVSRHVKELMETIMDPRQYPRHD